MRSWFRSRGGTLSMTEEKGRRTESGGRVSTREEEGGLGNERNGGEKEGEQELLRSRCTR